MDEIVVEKGSYSPASLHHHDLEKSIALKMLTPYSWSGEWPTVCRISEGGSASKVQTSFSSHPFL